MVVFHILVFTVSRTFNRVERHGGMAAQHQVIKYILTKTAGQCHCTALVRQARSLRHWDSQYSLDGILWQMLMSSEFISRGISLPQYCIYMHCTYGQFDVSFPPYTLPTYKVSSSDLLYFLRHRLTKESVTH